jgi:rhodanese-related sulfurtransferase
MKMAFRLRTRHSLVQQCLRLFKDAAPSSRLVAVSGGLLLVGCSTLTSGAFGRRLFISSSIAYAHPQSSQPGVVGGIREIPPSKDLARDLGKYNVIDVREPSERVEIGYVPGSINIPLDKVLSGAVEVPTGKPLLMVCKSGRRSMKAADALAARGVKDITNLAGGTVG